MTDTRIMIIEWSVIDFWVNWEDLSTLLCYRLGNTISNTFGK